MFPGPMNGASAVTSATAPELFANPADWTQAAGLNYVSYAAAAPTMTFSVGANVNEVVVCDMGPCVIDGVLIVCATSLGCTFRIYVDGHLVRTVVGSNGGYYMLRASAAYVGNGAGVSPMVHPGTRRACRSFRVTSASGGGSGSSSIKVLGYPVKHQPDIPLALCAPAAGGVAGQVHIQYLVGTNNVSPLAAGASVSGQANTLFPVGRRVDLVSGPGTLTYLLGWLTGTNSATMTLGLYIDGVRAGALTLTAPSGPSITHYRLLIGTYTDSYDGAAPYLTISPTPSGVRVTKQAYLVVEGGTAGGTNNVNLHYTVD